jgi:transposase-like protein
VRAPHQRECPPGKGLWRSSRFPVELSKVVYTTNAIESLNARFRRAVRHRGHFPNEQAALKVLYLIATQRPQNRETLRGKISGWKNILNALIVHYGDRITATNR